MKKIAIACASTLLACVAVELAHRLALGLRGQPYSAARAAEELASKSDLTGTFVPGGVPTTEIEDRFKGLLHPYYGTEREHDTGGVLRAFREGFGESDYTVVVVGGSVAAHWAGTAKSFARALEQDERIGGRDVSVLNFGHAAYKQPQQLMRIAYLFSLGYVPDAVINLDGFNEVTGTLQNSSHRIHPSYPPPPVWAAQVKRLASWTDRDLDILAEMRTVRASVQAEVERAQRFGLHRSSILGGLSLRRVDRLNGQFARLQEELVETSGNSGVDRQLGGGDFDRDPEAVTSAGVTTWFESSLSIDALCRARGVEYLHVLQSTINDEGSKPLSQEELALDRGPDAWRAGPRMGYARLRELGQRLSERGVHFLDASGVFQETEATIYIDACHVNDAGNEILSAAIAPAFLEML